MRVLVVLSTLVAALPAPVQACAVCGLSGTQDNWLAYLMMTVVLSTLPLMMIGGVVFWVYRRASAHDAAPDH